ncbi:polyprenyl synthetase family protein [Agrilutibacter solisilvae]|uniref:Polyprenyl synthetase family protein n=1 Tax=Agrilutibacter solisilvae TaxID=2763317 RepID=A0A974XX69_9GAMM|nr:polyprenyl synthetase family protein [Lysobacter solisilvae]QSX77487.1 polyprenyl synthetase family protein [Lysobacter solisilvae]
MVPLMTHEECGENESFISPLDVFPEAASLVEPHVRQALAHFPPQMLRVVGYHRGWHDPEGKVTGPMGLSPHWFACTSILAGRAVGASDADVIPAAVAMELVHDAAVILDDVTDNDETRYGCPAVWSVFGVDQAITAAAGLLSLAWEVLLSVDPRKALPAARLLERALSTAANGQGWDIVLRGRSDTSWQRCLMMSQEKTGGLVAGAASLGGLLGGGVPTDVAALHAYGWWCGLAGQIVNDVADLGATNIIGRDRADLRSRRMSAPLAAALESGGPRAVRLAELVDCGRMLTVDEAFEAADIIEEVGGRAQAVEARDHAVRMALESLQLLPESRHRRQLAQMADQITRCRP